MYNLDFAGAHQTFAAWERSHPEDPMGPVSDAAAFLFSEFERLHILQAEFFTHDENFARTASLTPNPDTRRAFESSLNKAHELASAALSRNKDDVNAQFAEVLRLGLHADYLALIDKSNFAALTEMKAGRVLAEKLLASHPDIKDAYLAVGVENYLLSLKPAPVRWVLHMTGAQTDKETGVRQLKLTAEGGRYLRPYARLLLAVAAVRDHDFESARTLLTELANQFPRNKLYSDELNRLKQR
jgi:hypothetical protein